jgi:endonuclease III
MIDFKKVFKIFKQNYNGVPLEIFKDPYRALISTVMSARTNDNITLVEANKLFDKAPTIKDLSMLDGSEIYNLIKRVGFSKTKARHLSELSKLIIYKHKGQIPSTREELMKLPGVGIKTANLVLNRAFNVPTISVDTHVHQITNILGWVKTKTPEQTLKELEKILPKKYWGNINKLFVSVGRQHTTKSGLIEFLKKNKLL